MATQLIPYSRRVDERQYAGGQRTVQVYEIIHIGSDRALGGQ